ncbi:glycoside hydrolase family 9 protein [Ruminiclostridium josui]|uniref:glycoside hydrolase family 9 protein n=1 Tax=Ruminiclostridium josui TaxID=1499 RepID=UPI000465B17E|nr:glycoside hydrolase family 9 protein [Ruminiclostridium josui]
MIKKLILLLKKIKTVLFGEKIIQLPVKKIKVNQVGYLPFERKVFMFTDINKNMNGVVFHVVRLSDHKAFKGVLGNIIVDKDSGDKNYLGEFSFVEEPGEYVIRIGDEESYPFKITPDKYRKVFYTAMRSYYLQRCGMEINDSITGVSHGPCHINDAIMESEPKGGKITATGGWHDAGDYGKYIPTAAVTVAQILLMYELSPETFGSVFLDIQKEKDNLHLPDILEEIKYELDWMLKMQDPKDGGVYFKISTNEFPPPNIAPEDDDSICYCYSKGTAVTANFGAAISIAARVFEKVDQDYSDTLKKAAIAAGEFLIKTNDQILVHTVGNTGAYLNSSVEDDLLWCYAELYCLTGNSKYITLIDKYWVEVFSPNINWDNVSFLAAYALTSCMGIPTERQNYIRDTIFQWTKSIKNQISLNGYRSALKFEEYTWGSNKAALAYGVSMILAQKILGRNDLEDEIKAQLDYVLGVNPLSKVYITKLGTDYVRNPHHRLIKSKGILIPGLLVAGPNNNAEDGFYSKGLGPKGYVDLFEACSCNEYAIDYNAPLVFVAGYLFMINKN